MLRGWRGRGGPCPLTPALAASARDGRLVPGRAQAPLQGFREGPGSPFSPPPGPGSKRSGESNITSSSRRHFLWLEAGPWPRAGGQEEPGWGAWGRPAPLLDRCGKLMTGAATSRFLGALGRGRPSCEGSVRGVTLQLALGLARRISGLLRIFSTSSGPGSRPESSRKFPRASGWDGQESKEVKGKEGKGKGPSQCAGPRNLCALLC